MYLQLISLTSWLGYDPMMAADALAACRCWMISRWEHGISLSWPLSETTRAAAPVTFGWCVVPVHQSGARDRDHWTQRRSIRPYGPSQIIHDSYVLVTNENKTLNTSASMNSP